MRYLSVPIGKSLPPFCARTLLLGMLMAKLSCLGAQADIDGGWDGLLIRNVGTGPSDSYYPGFLPVVFEFKSDDRRLFGQFKTPVRATALDDEPTFTHVTEVVGTIDQNSIKFQLDSTAV